jgi:hypothetical protein
MIKASFLQKQGAKYRELAREEVSLEMRRQLFALAARCDELAAAMARWPGPKDLNAAPPPKPVAAKVAAVKPATAKSAAPSKPKPAAPRPATAKPAAPSKPKPAVVETQHEPPHGAAAASAALPFAEGLRTRLVHGFAE